MGGSAVVEKPCCRATVWTRCASLDDFEPCYDVLILNLIFGWQNKVQGGKKRVNIVPFCLKAVAVAFTPCNQQKQRSVSVSPLVTGQ